MNKVPGDKKANETERATKNLAQKESRRKTYENVVPYVERSPAATAISGGAGAILCPAAFVWLVSEQAHGGDIAVGVFVFAVVGFICGAVLNGEVRNHMGMHLIRKMNRGGDATHLNRFEQWQLNKLFTPNSLFVMSRKYPGLFTELAAGKLPHISDKGAEEIMDGHLLGNPRDYDKLLSQFGENSIPKNVKNRYGRER